MNPEYAIDMSRQAVKVCMLVGGPILLASLLIGMLVGIFQALTQVQDQTVSFVPKFLLLAVAIGAGLPWLTDRMVDFARESFTLPQAMTARFGPPPTAPQDSLATDEQTPSLFAGMPNSPPTRADKASTSRGTAHKQAGFLNQRAAASAFPAADESAPAFAPTKHDKTTTESPFILPHYRVAQEPRTDQGT